MLGDIQSDINSFVGEALKANSSVFATADLNLPIQMCLNDLNNLNLLEATDTTQTLTTSDTTLNHPTDFHDLEAITLIDANSDAGKPLIKLRQNHKTYRELTRNDDNTGITEWFSDFDSKFWLWRPASQAYTTRIEYYRNHPQTPNAILHGEDTRNAIYFGTTYFKALLTKQRAHVAMWGPVYYEEKSKIARPGSPRIVRG